MFIRRRQVRKATVEELGKHERPATVKLPPEVYSDEWVIPIQFRSETATTVVRFLFKTYYDATGKMPSYPAFAMMSQAQLLIAKLGFYNVMQTLAFMSSQFSKYYQYPYTLKVVEAAFEELKQIKANGPQRTYEGFVGLRHYQNLTEKRR